MDTTVGDFLRSRRARIQPEDVGLPQYGRRRVPGLRREEVAQLAGVSVDYYVRLEQGRGKHVSDAVLDAVARVLRLDPTEREHLRDLARPDGARGRGAGAAEPARNVRSGVRLLLDSMDDTPAFVLGREMDVLAWNALGAAVNGFTEGSAPNMARTAFLDPAAAGFYRDWPAVAAETVAYVRLHAGRHPDDPGLAALIGELSMKSEVFRRLWADHLVKEKTFGAKRINHPLVGDLDFRYEALALPADPDLTLVVYTAPRGSATAERLSLLASWNARTAARGTDPDRGTNPALSTGTDPGTAAAPGTGADEQAGTRPARRPGPR